jgi:hypothetical protein
MTIDLFAFLRPGAGWLWKGIRAPMITAVVELSRPPEAGRVLFEAPFAIAERSEFKRQAAGRRTAVSGALA